MSNPQIEEGIPLPPEPGRYQKRMPDFAALQVKGSSFVAARPGEVLETLRVRVLLSAKAWAEKEGLKRRWTTSIKEKKDGKPGVRIWRTL